MVGNISLATKVKHSDQQVGCTIDAEVVLMSIENGEYYNLNPVASKIWNLLAEPRTIAEIVEQQLNEYEVAESVCEREVTAFITDLLAENLLQVTATETCAT